MLPSLARELTIDIDAKVSERILDGTGGHSNPVLAWVGQFGWAGTGLSSGSRLRAAHSGSISFAVGCWFGVSNIPTLNFAKNVKFRMGHPPKQKAPLLRGFGHSQCLSTDTLAKQFQATPAGESGQDADRGSSAMEFHFGWTTNAEDRGIEPLRLQSSRPTLGKRVQYPHWKCTPKPHLPRGNPRSSR